MNRTSFRLTRTLDRTLLMVAVLTLLAAAFSQTTRPTYVFQRQFDTSSLDPLAIDSPWTQSPIENLYEGLYGYAGATTEVAPLLATAHQLSEDGRVHTFSLRQGVTFHSGNPFTCQDVAYSFRRAMIMAPGIVAQSVLGDAAAVLHVSTAVRTDTEYADAWQRLTDGVRCADAHTLIVTSMAPDPILFAALMSPEFFVVDSELAAANADWDGTAATWRSFIGADPHAGYLHDHASGTGAFRLVSWQPGTSLVAERNPDYWGDSPHLQTVVYLVVEDETARVTALLAGEADQIDIRMTPVTALQDEPGVTVLDPAQDPSLPGGVRMVGAIFLNQNMGADDNELLGSGRLDGAGVPPDFFADADVRKCFAYAWDTGEDDPQYADDGTFYPHMLLHPMYSAYDDSVPHYKYDLGKAEEHCRAAWGGRLWENGMYLAVPSTDWIGATYKATLAALNPKFIIDMVELSPERTSRMWAEMQVPWTTAAGAATYPDAYEFMAEWYQSSTSVTARFGYANEEIDRLLEQARTELDSSERDALYRQVGRLAYEDAPFVLLPSFPYVIVTADDVTGAYRNPMFAEVRWADLRKPVHLDPPDSPTQVRPTAGVRGQAGASGG